MRSRLLCTLSLLVSNNSNGCLIENVYPLLEYIVKKNNLVEFDNLKIHDLLSADFGLTLPIHVIEYIVAQYHDQGYLREIDGKLVHNSALLPHRDIVSEIDNKIVEFRSNFTIFYHKYNEFLNNYSPTMACDSEEEFEQIVSTNIHMMFNTAYMVEHKDTEKLETIEPIDNTFCYSRFLKHIHDTDKPTFNKIIDLAVGYVQSEMLVSAALNHSLDLSDCTFYIDTRIVLDLLGAHGDLYQASSLYCINSLKEKGGSIAVFDHTYNEVSEILASCCKHWNDYNPGLASYALQNYKRESKSQSELVLLYVNLDSRIKGDLGLTITQGPIVNEKFRKLCDRLANEIIDIRKGWGFQLFDESSEKDAKSIITVMILRDSEVSNRLEDTKHLFLTSSVSLLRSVKNLFPTKNTEVGYCSSMQYICTLMWLTSSTELTSNVRLNAAAIAASVRPYNKNFMDKFIESFKQLSKIQGLKDEEVNALLQNHTLIELVELQACGNPVNVTAETTTKALELYHNRIKSGEIEKQEALQSRMDKIVEGVNNNILIKLGKIDDLTGQIESHKMVLTKYAVRFAQVSDFFVNGVVAIIGGWLLKSSVFKLFEDIPGVPLLYNLIFSIILCIFLYSVKRFKMQKVQMCLYRSLIRRSRYIEDKENKALEYRDEINDLIKSLPTQ